MLRVVCSVLRVCVLCVAENMRYRALLNSPMAEEATMMVARIVAVSPDVNRHLLTVDRGSDDGVAFVFVLIYV